MTTHQGIPLRPRSGQEAVAGPVSQRLSDRICGRCRCSAPYKPHTAQRIARVECRTIRHESAIKAKVVSYEWANIG